jgi:lipoprotein-anchoring transpeptidase ErfK/SrfK
LIPKRVTGRIRIGRGDPATLYNLCPETTSCGLKEFGQRVIMKRVTARLALAAAWIAAELAVAPARADVVVHIDKSSQRMAVSVDGAMRYNWPVSTGRDGYGTPSGTFHPQSMMRSYFSRKYYNAPMPHAIFFYYGFAIHGTNDISRLGGPASHGCVRLHPSHAAALFALVRRNAPSNTLIEISD